MISFRFYQNSIQSKIMTLGAVAMFIIAGVIIGYAAFNLYGEAFAKAEYNVEATSLNFGGVMNAELTKPIENAETLASAIQGLFESGKAPTREQVSRILETALENNPDQFGVYAGFEPNAFDNQDESYKNTKGSDETGRFVPYYFRGETGIAVEPLKGMDTDDYYQLPETTLQSAATEPYMYNAGGKDVLMASFVAPIMVNGKFMVMASFRTEHDSLKTHSNSKDDQ